MLTEEQEPRRRAKRFNEGVRIFATLLNDLAVGTLVAGVRSPLVSGFVSGRRDHTFICATGRVAAFQE